MLGLGLGLGRRMRRRVQQVGARRHQPPGGGAVGGETGGDAGAEATQVPAHRHQLTGVGCGRRLAKQVLRSALVHAPEEGLRVEGVHGGG